VQCSAAQCSAVSQDPSKPSAAQRRAGVGAAMAHRLCWCCLHLLQQLLLLRAAQCHRTSLTGHLDTG
jgi:hypothetical protein